MTNLSERKTKEVSKIYCDSDESVEHRFDSYIKLCIKHRIMNAFRDYRNKHKAMQEIPLDTVEDTIGYWDRYPIEGNVMQNGKFCKENFNPELNNLLLALPKRMQTVVILSVVYEMSAGEIAQYLNIDHSTVWNYKSKGISILRKHLKESGNGKPKGEGDK